MLVPESCRDEAVNLLRTVHHLAPADSRDGRDAHFVAEQNALLVRNAEEYYRTMVRSNAESWNIRDRHMLETLARLVQHHGPRSKAIVWEHNTHIGDARYTDMADQGEVNIGQLTRELYGEDRVVLVGFGTHRGTVIAAEEWEAPMEVMRVSPARPESWEAVLHRAGAADKMLIFDPADLPDEFYGWRGQRAVGVVYHPQYEQYGNYVPTVLPRRYDAFLFLDETTALHPLHLKADPHKVPETFPSGV